MIRVVEVVLIVIRPLTYDSDVHTVSGRRNDIRIENLSPILSDEERVKQRKCVEEGLFEIFIKYTDQREEHDEL